MKRLAALALAGLCSACTKPAAPAPQEKPATAAAPSGLAAWTDSRTLKLAVAMPTPARTERLELRHEPNPGDPARARLKLVYGVPEGEAVIVDEEVSLEQRDAAWGASYLLVAEPNPGNRRAVSSDGGKTYLALLPLGAGKWAFCPHKKVAAVSTTPNWPEMLTLERWATGVLETAVWGCDAAGRACKSRSMAGMTVHHGEPDAVPLAVSHETELRQALSVLDGLKVDRLMAAALLDATVNYQRGLDEAELAKLGRLAAKALADDGALTEEERKALRMRVTMARSELKKMPKDQLSPRVSVQALADGLDGVPQAVGGAK